MTSTYYFLLLLNILIGRKHTELLSKEIYRGTIIASVFTPDTIQLFSDGRLTTGTEVTSNEHKKVYKISDKCGMVTAGIYFNKLHDVILARSRESSVIYPEDIAKLVYEIIDKDWSIFVTEQRFKSIVDPNIQINICGYDRHGKQRLFSIWADGPERAQWKEIPIVFSTDINIFISVHSEGDANAIYIKYLKESENPNDALTTITRKAFEKSKSHLSMITNLVGGKTFEAQITRQSFINKP